MEPSNVARKKEALKNAQGQKHKLKSGSNAHSKEGWVKGAAGQAVAPAHSLRDGHHGVALPGTKLSLHELNCVPANSNVEALTPVPQM